MKRSSCDTKKERFDRAMLHQELQELSGLLGLDEETAMENKEIAVEELSAKLKERENQWLGMSLRKRVLFAFRNFLSNWKARGFYHSSWLMNEIKKDMCLIFRISSDKQKKRKKGVT